MNSRYVQDCDFKCIPQKQMRFCRNVECVVPATGITGCTYYNTQQLLRCVNVDEVYGVCKDCNSWSSFGFAYRKLVRVCTSKLLTPNPPHREEQRRLDEERLKRRQIAARNRSGGTLSARLRRCLPVALRRVALSRRAVFATATVLLGIYVYYRPDLLFNR